VSAEAASAEVVLEESDVAEFRCRWIRPKCPRAGPQAARIAITNGVTFAEDQTISLDFAGSTATEGTDFTVAPSFPRRLQAGESAVTALITAAGDTEEEAEETVVTAASG
jgi:hypothetical protein